MELAAIVVAEPAVPEALKVIVAKPVPVAVTVLLLTPAAEPSVQLVSVAMPELLVLTVAGVAGTMAPPCVRVKITAKPEIGLPPLSVTLTEGAVAAVPTVAL